MSQINSCFQSIDSIIKELKTDKINGLTKSKIDRARKIFGTNTLKKFKKTSVITLFLEQFKDRLVLILLASALISLLLGFLDAQNSAFQVLVEPAVILLILVANAIVGVSQEVSAAGAIDRLREFESKQAVVLRTGSLYCVEAAELVPGDILHLSVGQRVPADCRIAEILSAGAFMCDESMLTGETIAKSKCPKELASSEHTVLQDMHNMLFSGTLVVKGSCKAIVVKTGCSTELGGIQSQLEEINAEKNKTPLQEQLDVFADQLSKLILFVCIVVWVVNFGHFSDPEHGGVLKGAVYYFKIAVTLAVAAIPEGLPAVVTTCLALGTSRMARKKAIVRSLPSVETLGCTTVICSDKTGTLTTNQMSVRDLLVFGKKEPEGHFLHKFEISSNAPYGVFDQDANTAIDSPLSVHPIQKIAQIGVFCNESKVVVSADRNAQNQKIAGIPTEVALRNLSSKLQFDSKGGRLNLFDFDRSRKIMSTIDRVPDGEEERLYCHVKGAPEYLIDQCDRLLTRSGEIEPLDEPSKELLFAEMGVMASKGLRLLGFAYKEMSKTAEMVEFKAENEKYFAHEGNLVFAGVAGMLDPPREEVPGAVARCIRSGVRVKVITGDHKATAESICREIGILPGDFDPSLSLTGQEFMSLSASEQMEAAEKTILFSRVEPQHKLKLVRLLKKQGQVVAMTGDGVNDASALKSADIGVAMGSGTQVACEAADMVLQDDNFGTIVSAVEEGRSIYANTKQFIRYLISSNIGEVASVLGTALIGLPEALAPVQLLWVNLVTDGLPATALGFNPPDAEQMSQPPRRRGEQLIKGWLLARYVIVGCYIGAATVFGLVWWFLYCSKGPRISFAQLKSFHACATDFELFPPDFDCSVFRHPSPSSVSLSILVVIEMLNAFNAISENTSLFVVPPWHNIYVLFAVMLSLALHFAILYVPLLRGIFGTAPLGVSEWTAVIALSLPVILIDEILKLYTRNSMSFKKKARQKLYK